MLPSRTSRSTDGTEQIVLRILQVVKAIENAVKTMKNAHELSEAMKCRWVRTIVSNKRRRLAKTPGLECRA